MVSLVGVPGQRIFLLADTPESARIISTLNRLVRGRQSETHSRIAVRYKAAGAVMMDLGGSIPWVRNRS